MSNGTERSVTTGPHGVHISIASQKHLLTGILEDRLQIDPLTSIARANVEMAQCGPPPNDEEGSLLLLTGQMTSRLCFEIV